jgi:hypothetical protein
MEKQYYAKSQSYPNYPLNPTDINKLLSEYVS